MPAPLSVAACHFASQTARFLARDHGPDGARRAPRALEDVWKVLTDKTAARAVTDSSR
jgi:hypothetical protein